MVQRGDCVNVTCEESHSDARYGTDSENMHGRMLQTAGMVQRVCAYLSPRTRFATAAGDVQVVVLLATTLATHSVRNKSIIVICGFQAALATQAGALNAVGPVCPGKRTRRATIEQLFLGDSLRERPSSSRRPRC